MDELLAQFDSCTFYNLEHLSVKCIGPTYRILYLYDMIFSNGFPNLKSYYCNLGCKNIPRIEDWGQSPTLRILKIEFIESFVFKAILSACPTLSYLDCGMIISNESSSKIEPHLNLKQLMLRTAFKSCSGNEHVSVFKDLFECIPNLEKLSIHRRDSISILRKSLIKYDWFSSIIISYLPFLCRFYCYFHILYIGNAKITIGPHLKNLLNQIIENFQHVHNHRYQARLIVD